MIITGATSPLLHPPHLIILWLLTLAVILGRSTLFRKMLRSLKK
jgi:hypothetical protein